MARTLGLVSAIALASLAAGASHAQMSPIPPIANPLGQPLIGPNGFPRDEDMLRTPLLPGDQKYADLDGPKMKALVAEVVAISRKDQARGTLFWGRNNGYQSHTDVQDWTEAKFRQYGLTDIHREPVDLPPIWKPKAYDLTFTSGGETFKLASGRPAQSLSTPPGGLDLELVWVGQGSEADFIGRDVRGKAVLIQDIPLPGDIRHSAAIEGAYRRAYEKGAAAVGLVFGLSDNFAIWPMMDNKPGFDLGYEDGMKIRKLLGEGKPVRVKYSLDAERVSGLKSAHVWGTLPGATDEEILIVSHMDGYFDGALDNASGMAVMMNLIEHYAKIPKAERRRTIRFVGTAGHHSGPGTRSLHDKHDFKKTAFLLNLEHVAVIRTKYWGPRLRLTTATAPMRWALNASPAVAKIAIDAFRRFNVGVTADQDPAAVGEISPIYRDAPSLQVITSPEIKHTEQDELEWIPAYGLEQIARADAKIIDDINRLSIAQIASAPWPTPPPAPARGGDDN